VAKLVDYVAVKLPAPMVPRPGQVTIAPVEEPLAKPSLLESIGGSRVVLAEQDVDWEASLLAAGVHLLERGDLRPVEIEFVLQDARWAADPGSQNAERLERMESLSGFAGLQVARLREGEQWVPYVSGRKNSPADRVENGRILSAQYILNVGEIAHFDVAAVAVTCQRPVAESVDQVALLRGRLDPSVQLRGEWHAETRQPFHAEREGGPVFFDPESRSLWRFARAWWGQRVSRDEYLSRRAVWTETECAECKSIQRTRSEDPTADARHPRSWSCRQCAAKGEVAYFDGYMSVDGKPRDAELLLQWVRMEPVPGLFPVLSPGLLPNVGAGLVSLAVDERLQDPRELLERMVTRPALLGNNCCYIDEAGVATLLRGEEMQQLRMQRPVPDDGLVPIPVTDKEGRQVFGPVREPVEVATLALPARAAAVEVRVVRVQDARIVGAGRLALDYRSTLAKPLPVSVPAPGLPLVGWPDAGLQDATLRARLRARLVQSLVTKN